MDFLTLPPATKSIPCKSGGSESRYTKRGREEMVLSVVRDFGGRDYHGCCCSARLAKRANCAFRGREGARVLGLGSGSVVLRSMEIDGI